MTDVVVRPCTLCVCESGGAHRAHMHTMQQQPWLGRRHRCVLRACVRQHACNACACAAQQLMLLLLPRPPYHQLCCRRPVCAAAVPCALPPAAGFMQAAEDAAAALQLPPGLLHSESFAF